MVLPLDVRRFILIGVPSVPYLEALLLLRTDATSGWDAKRVAQRLFVGEERAEELLQALVAGGIAQKSSASPAEYHYRPGSSDMAAMLDKLAAVYAADLVGVTNFLTSRVVLALHGAGRGGVRHHIWQPAAPCPPERARGALERAPRVGPYGHGRYRT